MNTKNKNLDHFSTEGLQSIKGKKVAIVTAGWNPEVTFAMRDGAIAFLKKFDIDDRDLIIKEVPGSFELISGCRILLEREKPDGIIAIGCVIQGETPHFTFISQSVATGLATLNIEYGKPVIFGVLTTDNMEQARARSGGKHGNKGIEAASTLIKMLHF